MDWKHLQLNQANTFIANAKEALKKGDKRFYDALFFPLGSSPYTDAVSKELEDFKECPEAEIVRQEDDDVPF